MIRKCREMIQQNCICFFLIIVRFQTFGIVAHYITCNEKLIVFLENFFSNFFTVCTYEIKSLEHLIYTYKLLLLRS